MMADRVSWARVALFFALACAWSWPLFWLRDMEPETWMRLPIPHPLKNTLLMWGPGIAALICLRLFAKTHRRSSFVFGGQALRALAFYGLPMLALAAVGVSHSETGGQRSHALVLLVAVMGFLNVLGEELGWRGFLQDALRPLGRVPRYLLVGLLWALWHFTNLFAHREGTELLQYLAWYLPTTILLSALLGEATDRSRAVAVAVTLHAWTNLLWEFGGVGTYAVLAVAMPFWIWMLSRWPQSSADGNARPV